MYAYAVLLSWAPHTDSATLAASRSTADLCLFSEQQHTRDAKKTGFKF